jgi:hypothetical protein
MLSAMVGGPVSEVCCDERASGARSDDTVEVGGVRCEAIPAKLIIRAGLIAAASLAFA